MIEIPTNNSAENIMEETIQKVIDMIAGKTNEFGECTPGEAYLDWGIAGNMYKNCPSRSIAEEVAMMFKEKGYYTYYQTMGFGNSRIPQGTPTCIRILSKPHRYNNLTEF